MARVALSKSISVKDFAKWIKKFFGEDYETTAFSDYISRGTTQKRKITKSIEILNANYFNIFE